MTNVQDVIGSTKNKSLSRLRSQDQKKAADAVIDITKSTAVL